MVIDERIRRWGPPMLAALVLLLAADLVHVTWRHVQWRGWISEAAAGAATTQPAGTQPEADKKGGEPFKLDEVLVRRNPFTEPKVKGHGMRLTGVLGETALLATRDGKTIGMEVGQNQQGVKLKSLDGYTVVIEYEGKDETLKLFSGDSGGMPSPGGPPPGMRDVGRGGPRVPAGAMPEGVRIEMPSGGNPEEIRRMMMERMASERAASIGIEAASQPAGQ